MTSVKDRALLLAACKERDTYKKALEVIAATDRRKAVMMGVLAVADCVNVAKNALRATSEMKRIE